MSNTSQSNHSNKLSLIVYGEDSTPRYYTLNKKLLKITLTSLPFITVLCLTLVTLGFIYFQDIKESIKSQHPVIIKQLQEEVLKLESRNEDLEYFNQDLQERLASGDQAEGHGLEGLSIFRPVAGMQDLTAKPLLIIENEEIQRKGEHLEFSFHITNQTPDNERLSGYLFVLMKYKNNIHIYPESAANNQSFQKSFTSGESFATQKFRPVENIRFPLAEEQNEALFQVVIFSRSGDLIHKQLMAVNI